jgi:hypothetical protein
MKDFGSDGLHKMRQQAETGTTGPPDHDELTLERECNKRIKVSVNVTLMVVP